MDESDGREPSLLVLDGFNSLGTDIVNVSFIKQLYGVINGKKNLFVVAMMQNEDVANRLCSLNQGQRIAPLLSWSWLLPT
jgi:ABC-type uncharacterized transport system ATPase subunit